MKRGGGTEEEGGWRGVGSVPHKVLHRVDFIQGHLHSIFLSHSGLNGATCCSVLQCIALCCIVLQGVAGCCRVLLVLFVLQCVAVVLQLIQSVAACFPEKWDSRLRTTLSEWCVAVCCSMWQWVAVCCSVL